MKRKQVMFVVLMDRWVPQKYCDTREEAEAYTQYCQRNYRGAFEWRPCSEDYPRRFERAVQS